MFRYFRLDSNLVFTLHKTAGILAGCNVLKGDVVRCGAEERDPAANEHGYAGDDETLN